jgi:hypothetical protein
MCVKTLLTIHRNMRCKPEPNLDSIAHVGSSVDSFLGKEPFRQAFDAVCESRKFRFTRPEGLWKIHESFVIKDPKFPLHFFTMECPPVDCNDRTGGITAPLRVNTASGPNGPTLGTQSLDLCALKHTEPQLIEPIKRF